MSRRMQLLALICALFLASLPSHAWKLVAMGDSYGPTWHPDSVNGVNVPALIRIVNHVNSENVDFVIFTGDAVAGYCDDATLESQMLTWRAVMDMLNCPWYYTPGNHEINHVSPTSEDVLRAMMTHQPMNGPPGHERMVYSFNHENAHVVSLNSNHYNEAHKIQQDWLDQDLAYTTKPHIFVFAHEPAYPIGKHVGNSLDVYPDLRDRFWTTLTNHGVRMAFFAHEHHFARRLHGSVYQIHAATCGSPPYPGYPDTFPVYHYVVVDVNGFNVSCVAKDDSGAVLDTWSYTVTPELPISQLKALPDGTAVTISRRVVTAGTDQLVFTFYVEEADRSSGIRVYAPNKVAPYGSLVTVTGTLATSSGERTVNCSTVTVVTPSVTVPDPLCMLTREVGGGALNGYTPGVKGGLSTHNTGLLVQVCGRVTFVDTVARRFWVDDGCGIQDGSGNMGMCVSYGGLVTGNVVNPPAQGSFVQVTGISSRRISGSDILPVIRLRKQSDIVSY